MNTTYRARSTIHMRERGVAALVVILILLFSISGITLYAANTGLLEQKVSANDYRAKQLAEAADAGLNYAQAWLTQEENSITWGTAANGVQASTNNLSTTLDNGFTATIGFERTTAAPDHVLITATATETNGANVQAVAKMGIVQKKLMADLPQSPMVVNGCVTSTVGAPTIENRSSTYEIVTTQGSGCSPVGHWSGGYGYDVEGEGFDGSAWDKMFGMSMADMQALAGVAGSGVYWISQTTPWHADLGSLGPPITPVVAIFTGCPAINGNTVIVGIVYFVGPCTTNGWGGGKVFGTVAVDGDVNQMNANTELIYDDDYVGPMVNRFIGIKGRIPGTWSDQ